MSVTPEQRVRFAQACQWAQPEPPGGIGRLGEKTLHAVLKRYLEPDASLHERNFGRYVADIAREDGIIEIQTRNFFALNGKLACFLAHCPVTVAAPVAGVKWLSWVDVESGEVRPKRKSPKAGTALDLFRELYAIRQWLLHPRFSLRVLVLEVEEYRLLNGWGRGGKRGSTRQERVPVALLDDFVLHDARDYERLLPAELPTPFTSADLSRLARLSPAAASRALNVLTGIGAVERVGKQGNRYRYIRGGTVLPPT